jgi:hypothetical protein
MSFGKKEYIFSPKRVYLFPQKSISFHAKEYIFSCKRVYLFYGKSISFFRTGAKSRPRRGGERAKATYKDTENPSHLQNNAYLCTPKTTPT